MDEKKFTLEMTVAEALRAHPRAVEIFAGFNLGGCALCHIAHVETLAQVCETYGIDPNELIRLLEGLDQEAPVEEN